MKINKTALSIMIIIVCIILELCMGLTLLEIISNMLAMCVAIWIYHKLQYWFMEEDEEE